MIVVVKIGTSSLTDDAGVLVDAALRKLGEDVAAARAAGYEVVLVVSGAIAAGMPALRLERRPTDVALLHVRFRDERGGRLERPLERARRRCRYG